MTTVKKVKKVKGVEEAIQAPTAFVEPERTKEKPYGTYVLMFTIEGHKTWRISLFTKKGDLDVYLAKQPKHPKITEKRWFLADRISGNLTEEK